MYEIILGGLIAIFVTELCLIILLIQKHLKRKKKRRRLKQDVQERMEKEPDDELLAFRNLFSQSKDGGEAI